MATNQKKNSRGRRRRKRQKTKRVKSRHKTKRRRRTRRKRGRGIFGNLGQHVIKASNMAMSLTPQGQITKLSTKALCNRNNPPPICKSMTLTPKQRSNMVVKSVSGGELN